MTRFRRRTMSQKLFLYGCLILAAFIFLAPFGIMLMGSMQKIRYFYADLSFLIPDKLTFDNYITLFDRGMITRWLTNSGIITIIPVVFQVFLCTLLGYIFGKKVFKGRDFIFWTLMAMVMIPKQLLIIPHYIMYSWFGWINTYSALIVPELWGIMGVFLLRQFMQSIPKELEEAAYMDGASDFRIFYKIIMPLSLPAMATVGTFAFIANWNDLFTALIFMTSEDMFPITVGITAFLDQEGNFGIEMAAATVSFIPTFLVFLFFQRYFTDGINFTGMK